MAYRVNITRRAERDLAYLFEAINFEAINAEQSEAALM
jgi:hypothetical protein